MKTAALFLAVVLLVSACKRKPCPLTHAEWVKTRVAEDGISQTWRITQPGGQSFEISKQANLIFSSATINWERVSSGKPGDLSRNRKLCAGERPK